MSREAEMDAMRRAYAAALRQLSRYGWVPFGTHADDPSVKLGFSVAVDADGLPFFERVVS